MHSANSSLPGAAALAARRRRALAGCGLGLLLLLGGLAVFSDGQARDRAAQLELATAETELAQARGRLQLAERRVSLAETIQSLHARVRALGLTPAHWAERRLAIRDQSLPRDDANEVLLGTSQGRGRLFVADSFELSVTRFDEGLFHAPAAGAHPLRMSLRGTVLFRAGDSE